MQADYAVELGPEDEVLEFPWSAPAQGLQYYDLKRNSELLSQIGEAERHSELRHFLASINSPGGILETAKCDVWTSTEINPGEESFGCSLKFGSYIDLLFTGHKPRFSFQDHEKLAKDLCELLKTAPEIPAAADFLIRRCYFQSDRSEEGFYVTFYLFGYRNDEESARLRWTIGLDLVRNALLQLSSR